MAFSLVLDILVAVLLVVTIGYAVVLNRRLSGLRRDKEELRKLSRSFGEATMRASESISLLRVSADDLQNRLDAAQELRDDLQFLIERGGGTADRLEEKVRESRDADISPVNRGSSPIPEPAVGEPEEKEETKEETKEDKTTAKSEAERELLKALRAAR